MRPCTVLGWVSTSADHRLRCEHSSNRDFDLDYNSELQLEFSNNFELSNWHINCVSVVLVVYCR